jgi:hypothetical protein
MPRPEGQNGHPTWAHDGRIVRVWWLYTIVLGMAFGQVARNLASQAKRARLEPGARVHLATVLWEVFLLLLIVQVWIAVSYFQETVTALTVLELAGFLSVPVAIFVLTTILSENDKDILSESDKDTDGDEDAEGDSGKDDAVDPYERAFCRLRPLFFGVLLAMIAINLLHGFLRGDPGSPLDLAAQALLAAGALTGFFLRSRRADAILAVAMVVLIAGYIAAGYGTVSKIAP